jgi:hypothetical protein
VRARRRTAQRLPDRGFPDDVAAVAKRSASESEPGPSTVAPRRPPNRASEHWKRLLRRPARAPLALDAAAFVDELNRRLRADPGWRADTRFVVAAEAGAGVAGPTWEGPASMQPVIARIVKSVVGELECAQPFLFDR